MTRGIASVNDLPITDAGRKYHWPLRRRPDDHPRPRRPGALFLLPPWASRRELVQRCPKPGQCRRATRRILQHPPVPQTVQDDGFGPCPARGPAFHLRGTDVVVLGGQYRQTRAGGRGLETAPDLG